MRGLYESLPHSKVFSFHATTLSRSTSGVGRMKYIAKAGPKRVGPLVGWTILDGVGDSDEGRDGCWIKADYPAEPDRTHPKLGAEATLLERNASYPGWFWRREARRW